MYRFLQRVWTITQEYLEAPDKSTGSNQELLRITHKTIKKVSSDLAILQFNTAIAAMMEMTNELYKIKAKDGFVAQEWEFAVQTLAQLLAPFVPHIADELWQDIGQTGSVHVSAWPPHAEKYLEQDTMTIVVQVNGRVRANIKVPVNSSEDQVLASAEAEPRVSEYLAQKGIRRKIYVPQKLINFVVEEEIA